MTRIPFPSTPPQRVEPAVCALCQRPVNHDEIATSDVEGLAGHDICVYHGQLSTEPSFRDLRGIDNALADAANQTARTPPFGDTPWWEDEDRGVPGSGDSSTAFGLLIDRTGYYFLRIDTAHYLLVS